LALGDGRGIRGGRHRAWPLARPGGVRRSSAAAWRVWTIVRGRGCWGGASPAGGLRCSGDADLDYVDPHRVNPAGGPAERGGSRSFDIVFRRALYLKLDFSPGSIRA
jgi:hypothetical protein